MEKLSRNLWRWLLPASICITVAAAPCCLLASSTAEQALLTRAQSLATHGHLDMAVQTWQQVLLSDPNNKDALAGIAKADMQLGKPAEAEKYVNRLRALGASAATVGQIEAMPRVQPQEVRIEEARSLAQAGKYAEAMRIYHDVYGDEPPAGDVALAYYDTESAIPADRLHAVDGLRKLSQRFPADSRYAITLGRILTYDPKSRAEGIAILRQYAATAEAADALKQAEAWNEMAPATRVASASGAGENPVEAAAWRELNQGHLEEAQQDFQELLAKEPSNPQGLSGMGYVAMKEKDFTAAADYFDRARTAGARNVEAALALAHFWQRMASGDEQLKSGNSDAAIEDYRAAVQMKPASPDALEALAGALAQKGSTAEALDLFQRTLRLAPDRANAWRGLFLAQSSVGDTQAAVATSNRMPADVRSQLARDPDYLRALAEDDIALGRKADADNVVQRALALPFPNQGRDLPTDRQMQYAALLMTAQRYEPALQLYRQVVTEGPGNIAAWRALIAAQHQLLRDDEALATIGRMPQAAFGQIEDDAGFLTLIGSIYQSQHEWERAQKYLERALSVTSNSATALQLADVYAAEGKQQEAYAIYRREVDSHGESLPAWRGLLNILHQSGHDRDALRQLQSMPESTRLRLESDPDYLQALASIQVAVGQNQQALQTFDRLSGIFADQNRPVPPGIQIQFGWVLLKAGDDRKLYALATGLANTPDITDDEQANLNQLLAAWSVRRANVAAAAGDQRQSIAILEAAARAIPGNPDVLNTLAGAYLKAGEARRAVAIYASFDMSNASLMQYQGAIGAALAARDLKHAAAWLEPALDRFKGDAGILKMAADYEQATGNSRRAAAYYRAALAAMGPESSGEIFSHPGTDGNNLGDPQNGDSPTRDLMDLLAPKDRNGKVSESGSLLGDRQTSAISWQDAPGRDMPTLGDFAQSGRDESDLPVTDRRRDEIAMRPVDSAPVAHAPSVASNQFLADPSPLQPEATRRLSSADDCCQELHHPPAQKLQLRNKTARPVTSDQPAAEAGESSSALSVQSTAPALIRQDESLTEPLHALPEMDATDASPAVQLQIAERNLAAQNETSGPALNDLPSRATVTQFSAARQQSTPPDPGPLTPPPSGAMGQSSEPVPGSQLNGNGQSGSSLPETQMDQPAAQPLPPLTGPALPVRQQKTPREEIDEQLAVLQGASSGWLGSSAGINYRSGQPGYDRLAAYSAQTEVSTPFGPAGRLTLITQPVLLDSGTATGTSTLLQGTLPATAIPSQESASGIGGELQLRTSQFAARVGSTPRGFLIANVTGGLYVHPPSQHFTLTFSRDPILDTQLSYAGLRDQGSASSTFPGNVWGGVIANTGEFQIASGDSHAGWYLQGGGQNITGIHVPTNSRYDGDAGAYWSVWHNPEYGSLTVGMNFFGMHYAKNLRYFTYGQGGYFSPDAYVVAAVPLTFSGHYQQKFHYQVTGSLGAQAFNEESSQYYPLDPVTETAAGNPYYPASTNVGGNYNFQTEGSYAIAEHWFAGGYMNFNNTRDYASSQVGFFVRYVLRPQPMGGETGPTGLFPVTGYRPLQIP